MPDFAALQDCGAAPKELDFSGSNDPYNKPEYMADKVGLTPEQCEPIPPPTERDLVGQGFRQEPGSGGTNVWTTPTVEGTESASVAVRDHTAIAARPGDPEQPDIVKDPVTGEPRAVPKESPEQQFNKAVNTAASVATAGIAAGIKGDFASIAGLGGAIGDAIGVPFAGEAAALAGKVKDFLDKGGDMASLLNDPLGSMDNLADVLGALGIEVPPVLKAAIGEAKKIADALKQKLPPGGVPGVYAQGEFIARMGTSMTTHGTPLLPGPGAVTVLAMGSPVWRCTMDFHMCPIVKGVVPDVGGFVTPPTQKVVYAMGGLVARHKVDKVMEAPGGPNPIVPMTQAERAAEEKRKKEEEERKKKEEAEKKKRAAKEKEKENNPDVVRGEMKIHALSSGDVYEGDGGYYSGQTSKVGHVWVEVTGFDKDGNPITHEVVGRMPIEGIHTGWFDDHDGSLVSHEGLQSTSESDALPLSKAEYDNTMAEIERQRQDDDYTVLVNDCMDTVRDIAEAGDVEIPISISPSDMTDAHKDEVD